MDDQIYTPDLLATRMVDLVRLRKVSRIADFSMGDGALLKAGAARWPAAQLVGVDLDRSLVRRRTSPANNGLFGCCDFLCPSGRRRCSTLRGLENSIDLVILNPPFSNRSHVGFTVEFDGDKVRCGKAVAFLLSAAPYIRKRGEMVAVVPTSVFTSQRDSGGMKALSRLGSLEAFPLKADSFKGRSVATALLRFVKGAPSNDFEFDRSLLPLTSAPRRAITVAVARGNCAHEKHASRRGPLRLIHTTDLKNGSVIRSSNRAQFGAKTLSGPVVLLPRVGRPNSGKVVVQIFDRPVVISDCVIALQCYPAGQEVEVYRLIKEHWSVLEALYVGSCARYLTLRSLENFLAALGIATISRSLARGAESSKSRATISSFVPTAPA